MTQVHEGDRQDSTAQTLSASIRHAFMPSIWDDLTIIAMDADQSSDPDVNRAQLPLLVLPAEVLGSTPDVPTRVLIAVEGTDRKIAGRIASLLEPANVALALVHVTWVPGIASSPLPEGGLDNPRPTDLLLYRDADDALIDTADALRDAGFSVTTHLRENRHPADAIAIEVTRTRPQLVVLGRGRHGAGNGNDLLKEACVPVLYVDAR